MTSLTKHQDKMDELTRVLTPGVIQMNQCPWHPEDSAVKASLFMIDVNYSVRNCAYATPEAVHWFGVGRFTLAQALFRAANTLVGRWKPQHEKLLNVLNSQTLFARLDWYDIICECRQALGHFEQLNSSLL